MARRRVRLTMQRIAAATCPPDKAHVLLWDSERPGLCVRVYPSGRKVFTVLYRTEGGRQGRLRWLTIGEVGAINLVDAREAAGIHLGAVAKGRGPAVDKREVGRRANARLSRAINRYAEELERRKLVRAKETVSMLRRELLEPFGDADLAELDRVALVTRIEAIERSGLRGKAEDFRAKVGTFLGWAASSGLITVNPLAGWRRPRRSRVERLERAGRALGDPELPILWRAAEASEDVFFGAYVRFLLLTGQRRTETASMRRQDLDLPNAVWTIPPEVTKAGRAHRVPLPPEALALVQRLLLLADSDLVFPGRGGKPMSGWTKRVAALREVTASSGMGPWRLHDLRRTVRTGLGRLGVDPQISELLLNHAIGDDLTATYDRGDYWSRRVEAAARWARHVAGLVEGSSDKVVEIQPRRKRRG